MKKLFSILSVLLVGALYSCQNNQDINSGSVPSDVKSQMISLGFDVTTKVPLKVDGGYIVEGDIYLTDTDLASMHPGTRVPVAEQYSTNLLVTALPRTITVYIPTSSFSATYVSAVDAAISRYNALNLQLHFQRVTSATGATMQFVKLPKNQERQGVLGSSGFPTSSGNPYGSIQMSSVLESTYHLTVNGIATIMAHEMGHCIGMRHTDYYNRAISCGGSVSNEGAGTTGANLIPGTPSTATAAAASWMLACTDGSDRPFNNDDKTALNYLY